MSALDGVSVLDLTLLFPGPLCTQILLDLGAQVTKIEPPAPGDYLAMSPPMAGSVSAVYLALNHGKQRLTLNLKNEQDRQKFLAMVGEADVVVEGFRPGVLARLNVGYEQLKEVNPRIILCSISGYGQDGPLSQRAGHDLNYQALAGVLSLSGGEEASTPNPAIQSADTCGGSYAAAMLIMAALYERTHTNVGRHIDVGMSEQLLPLMTNSFAVASVQNTDPQRDGELLSGGAPCYRSYRTSDGRYFSVGALEPKFWQAMASALDMPTLADTPHLVTEQSEEITRTLAELFATKTIDEWTAIFAATDACCEKALTFSEVVSHEHWNARDSFQELETDDGGRLKVPKMPGSLAGMNRNG